MSVVSTPKLTSGLCTQNSFLKTLKARMELNFQLARIVRVKILISLMFLIKTSQLLWLSLGHSGLLLFRYFLRI